MGPLPFDPIDRAGSIWERKIGEASAMRVATSIMRVQQLLLSELEHALRPLGITFARYEVLRLISFSRERRLALSTIGERLMVHPTSVTNAIDRLEAQELVVRIPDPTDRRRTFAALTPAGETTLERATEALVEIDFGMSKVPPEAREQLYALLTPLRESDWT